jgi:hypothetical protein
MEQRGGAHSSWQAAKNDTPLLPYPHLHFATKMIRTVWSLESC